MTALRRAGRHTDAGLRALDAARVDDVLLAGGATMLSWPDALYERLATGGLRVVRFDLRDTGESTTADPETPAYPLRDLADYTAALADALGDGPAHFAGIGVDRSSPSTTARRSHATSPGRGCSSSMRPPRQSPVRRSAQSPRRCSRSGRGRRVARG
ncbi:alpha/beta fold hydrolase [Streptomyces sp. NPDC058301]|uniref:alpha/beta fold hydrolase n=1 Tax=Streptomyces sp. NPDC058301 TaxID=3346436 RepID=UPI0036E4EDA2